MGKMITGGEVYEAIRETCQRLYIAAGGDKSAIWTVKPFPDTACIAVGRNGKYWHLGMPAIPPTATLTTREADMFVAFGVHEILHALWTDFGVVAQSSREGLHSLCNALEDCRIENKAKRGLPAVAEAATLLEVLTNHVVAKASEKAPYRLDDAQNFAFTLGNIIFVEKLKYKLADFPRDWRAELPAHWLPIVDIALARFGSLRSTMDVLILARELTALGQSLQPQPQPQPQPQSGEGEGDKGEGDKGEGEGDKGEGDKGEGDKGEGDKGAPAPSNDASGAFPKKPDNETGDKKKGAGKPPKATGDEGEGDEGEGTGDEGDSDKDETGEGDSAGDGVRGGTSEGHAPLDLSDMNQNAPDAKLDDVADNAARRDGKTGAQAESENKLAEDFFSAIDGFRERMPVADAFDIEAIRAALSTPAKLRRDVTQAVKSPERVGRDRRQTTGRMDMRLSAQMRAGSLNVFSRRHDETGVQAAVSLLVDLSSSMRGGRAQAAAALALHLGDALKAAGVKFEIAGYYEMNRREDNAARARLGFCKEMNAGWTQEARGKTAALAYSASGGTATMPAAKEMARRLLNERNATRRILLVLTDGADSFSPESMKACRDFYAKLGVEIVCLAIMINECGVGYYIQPKLRVSFGKNITFVDNLSQIASAGLHELVTVLSASDRATLRGKAA